LSSSAYLATAPLTNTWYTNGAPPVSIQSDNSDTTNFTDTLSLNNVQEGTNFLAVFSDVAGSVTSIVANVDVVTGVPANQTVDAGSNVQFAVTISGPLTGPATPTFQWLKGTNALANGGRIAGATSGTLTITSAELSDVGTYTCVVTNNAGSGMALSATLAIVAVSPDFTSSSVQGTNVVLTFTSPDLYDTTNSFTLQRAPVVQGPYTNVTKNTTITGTAGSFQYTVPLTTNTIMFYRLLHN